MNATDRGVNPYAPGQIGEVAEASSDPYDPRAKGVDGDMLDAMMKGRWQEGYRTGYTDGRQRAAGRYQGIYDDGFATGVATGASEEGAALASELLPLLQQTAATLVKIGEKTSSEQIKNLCDLRISSIRATLAAKVGRHTDESPAAGSPGS